MNTTIGNACKKGVRGRGNNERKSKKNEVRTNEKKYLKEELNGLSPDFIWLDENIRV